jgi:heme-degrading monooxygenase HmoA
MFARSSTIRGQTSMIDSGIAFVRDEAMPALQALDGFVGLSMMVDRQSGKCIATSSWQSEQAMRASAAQAGGLRSRAAEAMGGDAEADEWEVALMHRAHTAPEGACVRATWTRGDPAQTDRSIDVFKLGALAKIQELDGFCSASLLVNRNDGRGVAAITYHDRDALNRTRDTVAGIRSAATHDAGVEVLDIGEFDLTLAHLRVPEMA